MGMKVTVDMKGRINESLGVTETDGVKLKETEAVAG